MAIPLTLHTIWFGGGPKDRTSQKCLRSQRSVLSEFQHKTWTESDFDMENTPFLKRALAGRNWAHMSDYVRLKVLYDQGGVYLDTDVQMHRPFGKLMDEQLFLGYMWDCNLGTAVIGSEPGHPIISGLLAIYDNAIDDISFDMPNNDVFTKFFLDSVPDFNLNGQTAHGKNYLILDKQKFEHPSLFRRKNYSVHMFNASWKGEPAFKRAIKTAVANAGGLYFYRKWICRKSLRLSPFANQYKGTR